MGYLPLSSSSSSLTDRKIVTTAADLSGTLSSSIEYFIDGIIDMGSQSIEIPSGGLNIRGYNFNISKLISTASAYTMFTSPVGGSGDLLGSDYAIEVTGASSKVYGLVSDTGFNAFEFGRINYNNCTSLGSINNYRQGLEIGTGRFGGSPTLELIGTWVGGYRITTSIVRSLSAGMTEPLFKAGAGFSMSSRFLTDINIDLPTSAAFTDFAPSNFPNPSTLQFTGAIISRNGAINADDANITPSISKSDLASSWSDNIGLPNTFVGGKATITVEVNTPIAVASTYVDLLGTYTPSSLEHFDEPANGQLRHIGNSPRDFSVVADITLAGGSNDDASIKVVKWDDSASSFSDVVSITRVINNLSGGRNVAFFTIVTNVQLDLNDYVKLQVANLSDTTDVAAEIDSYFIVEQR